MNLSMPCTNNQLTKGKEMSEPTKEYLQAKADLCRDLAISQILAGENEGMKNLMRMTDALSRIGIINEKEGE